MVFHLIESVFGTTGRQKVNWVRDTNVPRLVERGFSEEEAKNLSWINGYHGHGKWIGTVCGIVVVFGGKGWYEIVEKTFPRLYYHQSTRVFLAAGIILFGYHLGDHLYSSNWRGNYSNNQWTAITSPLQYIVARDTFIRNFEPLNRKFTPDEIRKFIVNHHNQENDEIRNFNYNPAIHGDSKEAFEAEVERMRHPKRDENTVREMNEQNSSKLEKGEALVTEPFKINEYIDRTGQKQSIEKFPIGKGWRPLH